MFERRFITKIKKLNSLQMTDGRKIKIKNTAQITFPMEVTKTV